MPETYLDHAASSPLLPAAREAVLRALDAGPGNPSSSHAAGRRLRRILGDAREAVAALVGARPDEIVFTSGTTESNALGVRGLLAALPAPERRLVVTDAAHESTRRLALAIAGESVPVVTVGVEAGGCVSARRVIDAVGDSTCVVALAGAQSVTGAVQPIAEIGRGAPTARVHCDAAQMVGHIGVDFPSLYAATMSFSAHKLGGPHGIGALVVRDGAPFVTHGAETAQERGRRPGTEAVALAAGFGAAARHAVRWPVELAPVWTAALAPLREFTESVRGGEIITPAGALPNMLLVRYPGCPGDAVLAAVDALGIRISTGTACASGARTPSHVLIASGRTSVDASECVRISVGHGSSRAEVERLVAALRDVLPRVRTALAR